MKYWHKRLTRKMFCELSPEQQVLATNDLGTDADDETYYCAEDGQFWRLGEFVVASEESRYDGVATFSNTAAFGIVFSQDMEEAVIQLFG